MPASADARFCLDAYFRELSQRFAKKGIDKFAGVPVKDGAGGTALLHGEAVAAGMALAALGVPAYPHKFDRRHTVSDLVEAHGQSNK